MKRWLPLLAVICLLWVGFAGCASSDDSSAGSSSDAGGQTADGAADGSGFKSDGGLKSDAAVNDSGEEASVVDSGEDGSVVDAGEDSGFDAGFDAGPVDAGPPFDVTSAASLDDVTITVTFDAPPNPTEAATLSNYAITGGLTLSSPVLAGNVVTLTTTTQSATSYTVTVTGVTRDADARALTTNHATFTGVGAFDVSSAASANSTTVNVTFDAPPNATSAGTAANYAIPGLTVSAAVLTGNVVTLTTSTQTATTFTVTVSGVTRASDGATLAIDHVSFTGHPTFNVVSAASTGATTVTVTFDAAPNATNGVVSGSYFIPGLTVSSASISGSVVTLTTSTQTAGTLTLTVGAVTRASDGEPLTTNMANFTGTTTSAPTVTNVVVASTSPNNGTTPYNTGTSTLTITGTSFTGVTCPAGVTLDDNDGAGTKISTVATSCTVDSDTQITAVFPSGIVTNGSTGWNVLVTNATGSNTTSSVKFVPVAGLLISEVLTGTSTSTSDEYLEIYNPTGLAIDTVGLGLKFHTRSSGGGDAGNHPITLVAGRTLTIASHGFLLFATAAAAASTETWAGIVDGTYASNGLAANGAAYLSLSTGSNLKVLDKVGWGSQPSPGGYEGTATADIATGQSIQRKTAAAPTTDTDVNLSDFSAPSTTISPTGSAP